jgi:cation:H+ antiporter
MSDLANHSIAVNLAVFAVASIAIWIAGSRVVRCVDAIADRTGIGQAFAGMLLLGGITSLPEIAAVSGASWIGNASLSVSNLLGSLCMNIVLLCVADAMLSPVAITSVVPGAATLLQGALGIIALALTAGAIRHRRCASARRRGLVPRPVRLRRIRLFTGFALCKAQPLARGSIHHEEGRRTAASE